MDTSTWESAIEAQIVFDGWRRIAIEALRSIEGATLTQYWVFLHLMERQKGLSKREVEFTTTSLGFQCASAIASENDAMLRTLFGDDYESDTFRQTIAALRLSLQDALEQENA